MRILNRAVYVGPSLYAHFPVIRLELDLGALEAWPTGRLGAAFVDGLVAALPGLADHGCSYREPGGFIRRMREGEGTWLGHVLEHVAIELQNVAGEDVTFGKTRSISEDVPACTRWSTSTRRRRKASPPANSALKLLNSLLPADLRTPGSVPDDWQLGRGARRLHPLRAAPRARPVDGLAGARRRGARHPLAAPEPAVADPVRPWQVPAAHPGDGHRQDAAHRGGAGQRQGGDQQDPRLARPAGAAPGTGVEQHRGAEGRAQARLSGRAQAVQRQPRPRHHHQHHRRRRHPRRVRVRARAFPVGHRRDLRRRRRPSPAGGQRRADRGDQAHARPRRRRRQADDRRSWSST